MPTSWTLPRWPADTCVQLRMVQGPTNTFRIPVLETHCGTVSERETAVPSRGRQSARARQHVAARAQWRRCHGNGPGSLSFPAPLGSFLRNPLFQRDTCTAVSPPFSHLWEATKLRRGCWQEAWGEVEHSLGRKTAVGRGRGPGQCSQQPSGMVARSRFTALPQSLEKPLRADHITSHPLPAPLPAPTGCTAFGNKARQSRIAVIKPCAASQKPSTRVREPLGQSTIVERTLELESGGLYSGPNPGTE